MKLIALVLLLLAAGSARAESYRPFGVSIVSPVEVFHGRDVVIVGASINAIYGRSRAVYGAEVGVANSVEKDVGLVQLAALVNMAGGGCYGTCLAGLGNQHGSLVGVQASLFANEAGAIPFGVQVGLINVIRSEAGLALQVGAANINNRRLADIMTAATATRGSVVTIHLHRGTQRGVQVGFVNGSDDYRGIQVAALFNMADASSGIQLGSFNVAGKRHGGIQAGAINYARTMRGLQLGFINISKELVGLQIGLLNIATANRLPVTVVINAGW